MKTNVESLKGLYEKLGGEDFGNVNTIPEAIDKVAEVATGGGGGGDNDFPVTAVLTDGMQIEQVSEDTHDIKAAFDAGKKVHLVIDGSVLGAFIDLPLTEIASDDSAWFGGSISLDAGTAQAQGYMLVRIDDSDDPDLSLFGVPTPSAADNGKVPCVVNGDYVLVNPSALSNDYKVTLAADASTGTITTTDGKTLSDILTACNADKNVYAVLDVTLGDVTIHQRYSLGTWMTNRVEFYRTEVDDSGGTPAAKPVCLYCQDLGSGEVWEPVG